MKQLNRMGLGCMGMARRNQDTSINTIHAALSEDVTLLNTGEFYNQGESELVVGEALKGVSHDDYFLSVKFGVLPKPEGGIYGVDVNPFHIKSHLTYSLRRLGLDYIDLYEPARMDTEIPVEDVVGEISKLVDAGYVRHIGLSMVDAETLRRACKVHPIHTVEMEYSLVNRSIEKELIAAANELGVKVLAFGAVGHGLLTDKVLTGGAKPGFGMRSAENYAQNMAFVRAVKEIADKKGVSISQLAIAWTLAKYDHVQSLIGTTNPEHLCSAIAATELTLTAEDIARIESAVPEEKIAGRGMRNLIFTGGRMLLG